MPLLSLYFLTNKSYVLYSNYFNNMSSLSSPVVFIAAGLHDQYIAGLRYIVGSHTVNKKLLKPPFQNMYTVITAFNCVINKIAVTIYNRSCVYDLPIINSFTIWSSVVAEKSRSVKAWFFLKYVAIQVSQYSQQPLTDALPIISNFWEGSTQ